jgi:outer membrane protein OmpA-like peptidoglycan-associated protein
MKTMFILATAVALLLLVPTILVGSWVSSAEGRMIAAEAGVTSEPATAIAAQANAGYCTPELKQILRRVLQSCGLLGSGEVRGCQPADAKQVAALAGQDFNALFLPMSSRAGVIQYDLDGATLDEADTQLIDRVFADQQGASYFFVVARASPEGSVQHNRDLSEQRANAVLAHLRSTFQDPDLDREVGLLWLGEEFAQLDSQFCGWQRSGSAASCTTEDLNRSAFVAWIDCRL